MIAATLLVSLVATVQGANTPGRALIWSSQRGDAPATYRSQSSTFSDVHNMLLDESLNRDFTVMFCSEQEESNEFFTSPHFATSVKEANRAVMMPNVYNSRENHGATLCSHAAESSHVVSVDEMIATLSAPTPLTHKSFMIPLKDTDHTSSSYETLLHDLHQKNALIVGLQSPEVAAPSVKGHYSRLLQESNQDSNYNPEGTEFTIYYQNTYLYLTPDLFTGLMTFLFSTFVLLTGFSCLNQIQGPSTFVHVMPTLGKEG
jgi:hypothetical protein